MRRKDEVHQISGFSLLFFCLVCSAFCLQRGPHIASFRNAIKQCSELGDGFVLSDPSFGPISSEYEKTEKMNLWLPYRRVVHQKYVWTDGTQAGVSFNSFGHELGFSCGAIDLENGDYDFLPCQQEGSSFICQIPDCSTCRSVNKDSLECLVLRNQCFTFHCGSSNWYRARESCKRQVVPTSSFWGKGEPKTDENCSIISIDNHDFSWRVASCDDKYWYICDNEAANRFVKTTAVYTSILNPESQGSTHTALFLIMGICLCVLILAVICLSIKLLRYRRETTETDLYDTNQEEREDGRTEDHQQEHSRLVDNRIKTQVHRESDKTCHTGPNKEDEVTFETSCLHQGHEINITIPENKIPDTIIRFHISQPQTNK